MEEKHTEQEEEKKVAEETAFFVGYDALDACFPPKTTPPPSSTRHELYFEFSAGWGDVQAGGSHQLDKGGGEESIRCCKCSVDVKGGLEALDDHNLHICNERVRKCPGCQQPFAGMHLFFSHIVLTKKE